MPSNLLCIIVSCGLSFFSQLAFASEEAKPGSWTLSDSRLIVNLPDNSAFINFISKADHPWLVSSSVLDADEAGNPTEKSKDFLVSPPIKSIGGRETLPLKVVRLTETAPKEEKLYWLRIQALPAKERSPEKEDAASLQLATTAWIKLFLRPENLKTDNAAAKIKLDQACENENLQIKNASDYWVTLRSLNDGSKELLDENHAAPLLPPKGTFSLKVPECGAPFKIKAIDDFGFLVPVEGSMKE